MDGVIRQKEIYLQGVAGKKPIIPLAFEELERAAQKRLTPEAFAYIAGGAGREETMTQNRKGFQNWQIVPRMLQNVAHRNHHIQLFGKELPTPFLLAPIGVSEMAHKGADIAIGQAAAEYHIPYIFSNQASVPMEQVAQTMGSSPRWFQLYWSKRRELVASLVSRAEQCGCEAIVVTLDTTLLGWRSRDLQQAYLPFLRGKGIAQYTSDPVFRKIMTEPLPEGNSPSTPINVSSISVLLKMIKAYPDTFLKSMKGGQARRAVQQFTQVYTNPGLTWEDLPFLRQHTKLPILLKGILHPEDAKKAINLGVDGIIVSNHGGRQVDGAVGSIAALPAIVEAVNKQAPVLFDSGIRSGADAFKAIALGATAVCIGRPYVYALAVGGKAGVAIYLKNLLAEFDLTMGLSGRKSISEIDPNCLTPSQ